MDLGIIFDCFVAGMSAFAYIGNYLHLIVVAISLPRLIVPSENELIVSLNFAHSNTNGINMCVRTTKYAYSRTKGVIDASKSEVETKYAHCMCLFVSLQGSVSKVFV